MLKEPNLNTTFTSSPWLKDSIYSVIDKTRNWIFSDLTSIASFETVQTHMALFVSKRKDFLLSNSLEDAYSDAFGEEPGKRPKIGDQSGSNQELHTCQSKVFLKPRGPRLADQPDLDTVISELNGHSDVPIERELTPPKTESFQEKPVEDSEKKTRRHRHRHRSSKRRRRIAGSSDHKADEASQEEFPEGKSAERVKVVLKRREDEVISATTCAETKIDMFSWLMDPVARARRYREAMLSHGTSMPGWKIVSSRVSPSFTGWAEFSLPSRLIGKGFSVEWDRQISIRNERVRGVLICFGCGRLYTDLCGSECYWSCF